MGGGKTILPTLLKERDAVFLLNQDAWIAPQTLGTLCTLARERTGERVLPPPQPTGGGGGIDPVVAE